MLISLFVISLCYNEGGSYWNYKLILYSLLNKSFIRTRTSARSNGLIINFSVNSKYCRIMSKFMILLYYIPTKNVLLYKIFFWGGVYIGLDFFVTAVCFSVLGYGLCYITLSCNYYK